MYQQLLTYLAKWNNNSDDRHKLQHVYAFGGVIVMVIAGLVSLVSYEFGQALAGIALMAIAIFFINAIVWALLSAFMLTKLDQPKNRTKKR